MSNVWEFQLLHILASTWYHQYFLILPFLIDVHLYLVILIWISLMTKNFEHLHVLICHLCIYFLMKYLSQIFVSVLNWVICFIIKIWEFLLYSRYKSFIICLQIFHPSTGFGLFIPLKGSFTEQIIVFVKSSYFSVMDPAFDVNSKKSLSNWRSQNFLLCFLLKILWS